MCRPARLIVIATLTLSRVVTAAEWAPPRSDKTSAEPIVTLEKFVTSEKNEDPNFILPTQPIESVFGFAKTVQETPRSVTVVSSELISQLSLSDVHDLTQVVPNTHTESRWGVQGNINVRGQGADIFFRGMKRIDPGGNSRTALGANDQIEVVRGAPPPYLAAGKLGGYTNFTPKAGRARDGTYLKKDQGFVQLITGDFGRREVSLGYGGPLNLSETRRGGYYVYGMVDDSDGYYKHVPVRQRIFQGAISQEISKNWRVETGVNYSETITAGAFTTRWTTNLMNKGMYWAGRPLVRLDADGSGKISQREMELGSPMVLSQTLSSTNKPLLQRIDARYTGAARVDLANPATIRPTSALGALIAMRPQFVARITHQQTLNMLNVLPRGFVLDPDTMKEVPHNWKHVAIEKEMRSKSGLAYLDFINDSNPDLQIRNQMFGEFQDQFKNSELPFMQEQSPWLLENKLTVHKPFRLPFEWMELKTVGAVNVRHVSGSSKRASGDYDNRPDLSLRDNVRTPDDVFINAGERTDYQLGMPWTQDVDSDFTEYGIGALADLTFWRRLNVMLGYRVDYIQGQTINHRGTFITDSGLMYTDDTNLFRRYTTDNLVAEGNDLGTSYSFSATYKLPFGLIPYVNYSVQAALADNDAGNIARETLVRGPYNAGSIREVGIKGALFKNKMFWAVGAYRQAKIKIYDEDDVGGIDSTIGRGIEAELRWVPNRNFYVMGYAVVQKTVAQTIAATSTRAFGAPMGFADVKDASGNVIFPAEAFVWGGQASVTIPAGELRETNIPNTQFGLSSSYTFNWGLTLGFSGVYASSVDSGPAKKMVFPNYTVWNASVGYVLRGWKVKLDLQNLTDELYFRPRNDEQNSPALPRRIQVTLARNF